MKHFKGTSLKIRLYILILAAFIPVAFLIVYLAEKQKVHETDLVLQHTLSLARAAANEETQQIEATRDLLTALAGVYLLLEYNIDGVRGLLQRLLDHSKGYSRFGIIGKDGRLVAATGSIPSNEDYREKAWFIECLKQNELVMSRYQGEMINNQPVLYYGLPVQDTFQNTKAVVFAAVTLNHMNRIIFKRLSELPEGSRLTLIDEFQGMISYDVDSGRWYTPNDFDTTLYTRLVTRTPGTLSMADEKGDKWIYAFAPMDNTFRKRQISVMLQVPRSHALYGSKMMFVRNLSLLIISALIAILSIWWVSNVFILKRLGIMALVSRDLAAGNLDARIGKIGGSDELSHLAGVFDEMAASLQARILQEQRVMATLEQSREQLRHLAAHQQAVLEEERRRIARELHDQFGQSLTVLKLDLSWLKKQLPGHTSDKIEKIDTMSAVIDEAMNNLHAVTAELRPGVLDDFGLVAAVEWQIEEFRHHSGIECRFENNGWEPNLSKEQTTALFRVFQELLTNVMRHADANQVTVTLRKKEDDLLLIVKDNGRGITKEEINHPDSYGLLGIRERLYPWNGHVVFEGHPGQGTHVKVQLPLSFEGDFHD